MLEPIFGGLAVLLVALLVPIAGLFGVAVPYAVLRVRDAKSEHPDPQLGLKVAYLFFFSLGVLMIHVGLTVNVADLLIEDKQGANAPFAPGFGQVQPVRAKNADGKLLTPAMRTGWALVASGLLFSAGFGLATLLGTNLRRFPAARRVFVGWRLVVAGLAVVVAVTTLCIWFFSKDQPDNKTFELAVATLAVFAPSLAVHVFLMQRYAKKGYYVPPPSKTPPKRVEEDDEDEDED